eukprot:GDKJ01042674.1.p1 GENE.GDKJ01042674.1~~GDKJ01042674.1.p1  ORF type:complete len:985 (+),score=237.19 GDKJ01042674.1:209-2956(+)
MSLIQIRSRKSLTQQNEISDSSASKRLDLSQPSPTSPKDKTETERQNLSTPIHDNMYFLSDKERKNKQISSSHFSQAITRILDFPFLSCTPLSRVTNRDLEVMTLNIVTSSLSHEICSLPTLPPSVKVVIPTHDKQESIPDTSLDYNKQQQQHSTSFPSQETITVSRSRAKKEFHSKMNANHNPTLPHTHNSNTHANNNHNNYNNNNYNAIQGLSSRHSNLFSASASLFRGLVDLDGNRILLDLQAIFPRWRVGWGKHCMRSTCPLQIGHFHKETSTSSSGTSWWMSEVVFTTQARSKQAAENDFSVESDVRARPATGFFRQLTSEQLNDPIETVEGDEFSSEDEIAVVREQMEEDKSLLSKNAHQEEYTSERALKNLSTLNEVSWLKMSNSHTSVSALPESSQALNNAPLSKKEMVVSFSQGVLVNGYQPQDKNLMSDSARRARRRDVGGFASKMRGRSHSEASTTRQMLGEVLDDMHREENAENKMMAPGDLCHHSASSFDALKRENNICTDETASPFILKVSSFFHFSKGCMCEECFSTWRHIVTNEEEKSRSENDNRKRSLETKCSCNVQTDSHDPICLSIASRLGGFAAGRFLSIPFHHFWKIVRVMHLGSKRCAADTKECLDSIQSLERDRRQVFDKLTEDEKTIETIRADLQRQEVEKSNISLVIDKILTSNYNRTVNNKHSNSFSPSHYTTSEFLQPTVDALDISNNSFTTAEEERGKQDLSKEQLKLLSQLQQALKKASESVSTLSKQLSTLQEKFIIEKREFDETTEKIHFLSEEISKANAALAQVESRMIRKLLLIHHTSVNSEMDESHPISNASTLTHWLPLELNFVRKAPKDIAIENFLKRKTEISQASVAVVSATQKFPPLLPDITQLLSPNVIDLSLDLGIFDEISHEDKDGDSVTPKLF